MIVLDTYIWVWWLMDLFCRMYVQSDLPHQEFIALLARCTGGTVTRYEVRSRELDIYVDKNDDYDARTCSKGNDRWLYFRYALDIDPMQGVDGREYVEAIGRLLSALWSLGIDAVAASAFEDQLPINVRQRNWQA